MWRWILCLLGGLLGLTACSPQWQYRFQEGFIYGSTYRIIYEYKPNRPLEKDIQAILDRINRSMSMYDSTSLLSRINRNDPSALPDEDLKRVLARGLEISEETEGAFDLTVAPLVNAWGFGFTKREAMTPELIDSLLEFTGYRLIRIDGDRLIKLDPRVMIDPNAIVPGYVSDLVAHYLESRGVKNYLVEIGGELRCKGLNPNGQLWRVGVDKPLEGIIDWQIQVVLHLGEISVTTSGNYRKFYEEGGVKYSHTIDPRTGYPARSNLLSATV
ncbi:MAG: FAD:protein FMN transferase, partial [Bacteroidales bacterium]